MIACVFGLNVEIETCAPGSIPASGAQTADVRLVLGWPGPPLAAGEQHRRLIYGSPNTTSKGLPVFLASAKPRGRSL